MNWYLDAFKKYAVFAGRSRRKEYWFFILFNIIAGVVLGAIDVMIGTSGMLGVIYGLVVLIPGLAVMVRRLHDTDRTGWWFLIGLVPVIGTIVLFIFMVQDGTPDKNQYGPNPKTKMV